MNKASCSKPGLQLESDVLSPARYSPISCHTPLALLVLARHLPALISPSPSSAWTPISDSAARGSGRCAVTPPETPNRVFAVTDNALYFSARLFLGESHNPTISLPRHPQTRQRFSRLDLTALPRRLPLRRDLATAIICSPTRSSIAAESTPPRRSTMSSSLPGSRQLPASQYDLSTYWGRVQHAVGLTDPR